MRERTQEAGRLLSSLLAFYKILFLLSQHPQLFILDYDCILELGYQSFKLVEVVVASRGWDSLGDANSLAWEVRWCLWLWTVPREVSGLLAVVTDPAVCQSVN